MLDRFEIVRGPEKSEDFVRFDNNGRTTFKVLVNGVELTGDIDPKNGRMNITTAPRGDMEQLPQITSVLAVRSKGGEPGRIVVGRG